MSLSLLDRSDKTGPSDGPAGRDQSIGHGPGSTPAPASSAGYPDSLPPSGPRVLVVDDSNSIRTEIRHLLEEAGIAVVGEGSHGAEGVMLARELRPDVVVMDVRMPILDGIAATGYITRELPGTQVIVVSAFDDNELADAARAAGAAGFLTKSSGAAAIAAAVRDAAPGA